MSSEGKSSLHWLTKPTSQLSWMRARGQAESLQAAKQCCRHCNKALSPTHMHNGFFVLSPPGYRWERYALSAMPASMRPAARSAQESSLGVCGCRRRLQRHRVPFSSRHDSAKQSILFAVNTLALEKRIHLEDSVMFLAWLAWINVKDTCKKKEVKSYLMAFPCEGSSGPDDHMTHPVIPLHPAAHCLGHSSPYHHDNVAALPHHVFVPVHVWERSSSSELNSGRTWYSLDMVQSQVTACYYYIVCKLHLILADKGKNSIDMT